MSLSLLLQHCPTRFVRLTWMVLEIGGRWPYCCRFVGCGFQNLFNIPRRILLQFSSNFFSIRFVSNAAIELYWHNFCLKKITMILIQSIEIKNVTIKMINEYLRNVFTSSRAKLDTKSKTDLDNYWLNFAYPLLSRMVVCRALSQFEDGRMMCERTRKKNGSRSYLGSWC